MAQKQTAQTAQTAQPKKTIEDWLAEKNTKAYVFAAVMEAKGWARGKKVTAKEYDTAINDWLNGSMSGRDR